MPLATAVPLGQPAVLGDQPVVVTLPEVDEGIARLAEPGGGPGDRIQHRLQPGRPAAGTPGTHGQDSMPPPRSGRRIEASVAAAPGVVKAAARA
jgi:hypothetical protein